MNKLLLLIPTMAFLLLLGLNSSAWENPVSPKRQSFYNNDGSVYTGPNRSQYQRTKFNTYNSKTGKRTRTTCRQFNKNSTVKCTSY